MIDAPEKDLNKIKQILTEYVPGLEVRVFGSRVNGRSKPYSDLDLVIVNKEKIDRTILIKLREAFQESNLPFRVDVLDWNRISADFQNIIARNYVIIQK